MKRVIAPLASGFAALLLLARCAAAPPVDNGPLTPVGDMSQTGVDSGVRGTEHDYSGVPPGLGGGVDGGPAVPGGLHGSGKGLGEQ